ALIGVSLVAIATLLLLQARYTMDVSHERDRARDGQEQARQERDRAMIAEQLARDEMDKAMREMKKANRTAQVLASMFEAADPLGLKGIPALKPRAGETITAF